MEKSRCSAESGMGPLYDPWTRTSHLTVPAATAQEAKEMKPATNWLWASSFTQLSLPPTILLIAWPCCFLTSHFDMSGMHCLNVLYLLCFWTWATNATALSDECDLKAPVCSVSSRPLCHPSEACEWLVDLCFNVLETFHFIWQISSMLQALIKGSFFLITLMLWL